MNLADESYGDGEFGQTGQAVVHCGDVVDDFIDILGSVRGEDFCFCGEHILEGALGSFDLA